MMDGENISYKSEILDESGYIKYSYQAIDATIFIKLLWTFREAADSAPSFGDREKLSNGFQKTRKSILEKLEADMEEGS